MKTIFLVFGKSRVCSLRESLNKALAQDQQRNHQTSKYPVQLKEQKKNTRPDGWSKVISRYGKGSVNYRWSDGTKILECWAVTKGKNRPFQIISEFIETLLLTQKKKVRSIHIEME